MNQWHDNVLPNYQLAPQNPILGFSNVSNPVNPIYQVENDQEVSKQMATNEIDSWLLPNPDSGEDQNYLSLHPVDGCLNLRSCSPWARNQYQGQFNQMQSQGSQVNYNGNYGMLPVQSSRDEREQILEFSQGTHHDFSRSTFNNMPASFIHVRFSSLFFSSS